MRRPPDPPPGLTSADPREWTRAWARVIAVPSVKLTGFACAHFADYRTGASIRPGVPLLQKVCGLSDKPVRDALKIMREWGLIWRYVEGSRNGRNGDNDEYRLTFPDDITAVPMLSPDWEAPVDNPPNTGSEYRCSRDGPAGTPVVSTGDQPGTPVVSTGVPNGAPLIGVLTLATKTLTQPTETHGRRPEPPAKPRRQLSTAAKADFDFEMEGRCNSDTDLMPSRC